MLLKIGVKIKTDKNITILSYLKVIFGNLIKKIYLFLKKKILSKNLYL